LLASKLSLCSKTVLPFLVVSSWSSRLLWFSRQIKAPPANNVIDAAAVAAILTAADRESQGATKHSILAANSTAADPSSHGDTNNSTAAATLIATDPTSQGSTKNSAATSWF
jgi:hypothetical protein